MFKKKHSIKYVKKLKYTPSPVSRPDPEARASDRLTQKQRHLRRRKFIQISIILGIIFLIYILFFSPIFKIKKIQIERPEQVEYNSSDEEIYHLIEMQTYKFRWLFFPQRNLLVLSKKKLIQNIASSIEINQVKISKKFFSRHLKIVIHEKQPAINLICQGKYYLFSNDGHVIQEIDMTQINLNLPQVYYQPEINEPLKEEPLLEENNSDGVEIMLDETGVLAGQNEPQNEDLSNVETENQIQTFETVNMEEIVIDSQIIKFIYEFSQLFDQQIICCQIDSWQINQPNPTTLTLAVSEGWQIYTDPQLNPNLQLRNLSLVLDNKINSDERLKLEYIDLRFGDRVYYK
jgi:cell division septal protein FtsQ